MTPAERRLFAAVLEIARGRLTKRGHVALLVTTEHRGICNTRWPASCGPTCLRMRATLDEAAALLARQPTPAFGREEAAS